MGEFNILFCCMGNICRSPMAEGVFQKLLDDAGIADRVGTDSAGTHADFPDAPPDPRAQRVLAQRGIDISQQRARPVTRSDFDRFDLILVMDGHNYDMLRFVSPRTQSHKIGRLLDYAPTQKVRDVPDPFHGEDSDFVKVLELVEIGSRGLLDHVIRRLQTK